jgi:dUTPase
MVLARIAELVSQAEREGVTLAAMMSKKMSPEEMELVQIGLMSHISDNYSKIEGFMTDVSVPSIEEFLARGNFNGDVDLDPLGVLSDD